MKMSRHMPFIVGWLIALLFLWFCATSCTETIYEEVIKLDTVFVARPVTSFVQLPATRDTVVIRDTVTVTIVQHDTIINNIHTVDTVLQVVTKDSLIIKVVEKEIFIRDTVVITNTVKETVTLTDTLTVVEYETRIVYLNTEYIYLFPGQSTFYIPDPFMPHYNSFISEANARNKLLPGGDIVLVQVDPNELAGENWISDSFEVAGFQWVIRISDKLTVEQSKSAIFRELGRMQLKKKYSNDVTRIMSPLYPVTKAITTNDLNILFQ